MILLGALTIIRYSLTAFSVYRSQTIALLIGCVAPILASLPAVCGLTTLSLPPFGLVFTCVLYTWAVLRSGLLDLRPIARDLLIEQMQDGMIIIDERYVVVDFNPPALKILSADEQSILGSPADEIMRRLVGRVSCVKDLLNYRTEIELTQYGQLFHYLLILSPLLGIHQQVIGRLIHLHDITGLKKVQEALRSSESQSRAIIAALPDEVHLIDQNGFFMDPDDNPVQENLSLFEVFSLPLAEKMLCTVRETLQSRTCQSIIYQIQSEDGAERWFEARTAPLPSEIGQPARVIWIDRETAEQIQLYQEVERLANTDMLTGLANRRHFFNVTQAFVNQNIAFETPCSFILIDIDHFKNVNDRFGHLMGDEVLRLVADRLADQVRAQDVVARYGGEEFAVFLPNAFRAEAEQVAERLCCAIASKPLCLDGILIPRSISVGMVSSIASNHLQIDKMIGKADDALYAAKRAGRNMVKVFDEWA